MDELAAEGIFSWNGFVYYKHADTIDGSYVSGKQVVEKLNVETGEMEPLASGTQTEFGVFTDVIEGYLIFQKYSDTGSTIRLWNIENKEWEIPSSMEKSYLRYLNQEDGKVYYTGYDLAEGQSVPDTYYLYEYNLARRGTVALSEIDGNPHEIYDGYLLYEKNTDETYDYSRIQLTIE